MARPREFDPDVAIERTFNLFWEKGYEETSFEDIVEQTHVSRYGLYGTFGNKKDLFRKALAAYADYLINAHQGALRGPNASLAEIRDYFHALLSDDLIVRRGCMMCNTAFAVAPNDPEIGADVRRYFDDLTGAFRAALANAKQRREIRPDADVDDWAIRLTSTILSAALLDRVWLSTSHARQIVEATFRDLEKGAT